MQQEKLVVHNLSVTFLQGKEEVRAVEGLSFSLKKGCTTGIVGESGSGKSVTALALMGLLPKSSDCRVEGEIALLDENRHRVDLAGLSNRQMQHIRGKRMAMIFQEPMTSLNPVMRCGNQVMEAILAHRRLTRNLAKARTLDLFREVRLPDPESAFRAYPHELSGGQKQRVMIAMAVASEPDILIADEPTTALDMMVQKSILGLLKDLQKKYGLAVLFISHDLRMMASVADELLVMHRGKVVEAGPAEQVFQHPSEPYTQSLLACRPPTDVALSRLPVISDFKQGREVNDPYAGLLRDEEMYRKRLEKIYNEKAVLETQNLSAVFRGKGKKEFRAVREVSLKVFPGEVLGLVGESGCGKTTLGRTLLRLKEPSAGSTIFQNIQINAIPRKAMKKLRKELQIVFQDPFSSLNPRMLIGKAIMEPMIVHGIGRNNSERKETVMQLLEKTGLERGHFYRYPHEFSGGQRQRICIARALSVRPKLIIFDESVSALDVSVQAQILNLLNDLREEFGFTYIFISHDLAVVRFISDRIAVMNAGRIVEEASTEKLFRHPETEYTKELIDSLTT